MPRKLEVAERAGARAAAATRRSEPTWHRGPAAASCWIDRPNKSWGETCQPQCNDIRILLHQKRILFCGLY
jgi:hypothetical protein